MADPFLPPPWLDTEGRREGRYVIGPLLGKGGMGEVFEAWDLVLARLVALKILRHLEPAAMIRFMHEAQLHARMDLPGICRIYDVDASNGSPRIAMQLVRGPTLEDAAPELTLEEIVELLARVADTIHAAHQLKLIHRDLKPSNILLQWQEGGWAPFICDFGLAMAVDGPSVTQPLAMTGTPAYMAPEQVRGDRSLTCPATDVYGIGSTLYFALTGRPPCVSTVSAEVLLVKRNARFPSPRSLEPEIPPALERILLKCLQPAIEDRYPSAAELAGDLRRFLNGEAPAAVEAPAGGRRAWLREHRLWLAGGLAVAVLAGSLFARERAGQRRQGQSTEQTQHLALEAANLEQLLRNERLLPVHDLRPAFARTRARMEALRQRLGVLDAAAEGPVHYALGRANYAMRDYPEAAAELERAWAARYRTPDAAFLLARSRARAYREAADEAAYQDQPMAPNTLLAEAEAFLAQAKGLTADPPEFAEAVALELRGDPARAQERAAASLKANPWHLESAVLEVHCLCAQARQRADQGERGEAGRLYQAAQAAASEALARGQSEERLHHAWAGAALGSAGLALERGELPLKALEPLARHADQALVLDPEQQEAQSDWLRVRCLRAQAMLDLGQDPRPVLDEALQFYWSRTREPRSLALRTDHMLLYGLQARRDQAHGEDPGPALAEALKGAGHAGAWPGNPYGDLLNLKARLDAGRGQDPRPSVELVLQHFGNGPAPRASACETAAEACLIRARWEQGHGIDPLPSLRRGQALLERALQARPDSASGHGLLGQLQVLEARITPDDRARLLRRAQEQLKLAQKLGPQDRHSAELRTQLAGRASG